MNTSFVWIGTLLVMKISSGFEGNSMTTLNNTFQRLQN